MNTPKPSSIAHTVKRREERTYNTDHNSRPAQRDDWESDPRFDTLSRPAFNPQPMRDLMVALSLL